MNPQQGFQLNHQVVESWERTVKKLSPTSTDSPQWPKVEAVTLKPPAGRRPRPVEAVTLKLASQAEERFLRLLADQIMAKG